MLEGTVRSHLSSRQQIGPASARGRGVRCGCDDACACLVVLQKSEIREGFVLRRCMGPEVIMAWENHIVFFCFSFTAPRRETREESFRLDLTGNRLPVRLTDIGSLGDVWGGTVAAFGVV